MENGKKSKINWKAIVAIVIFLLTAAAGYGELKQKVNAHAEQITELKPVYTQVATMKTQITNTDNTFCDFRTEQRKHNKKTEDKLVRIDGKMDNILQAVLSGR